MQQKGHIPGHAAEKTEALAALPGPRTRSAQQLEVATKLRSASKYI